MKLSIKGEKSLRTLMELALAYPGKPLILRDISNSTQTSVKFLEQILLLLRRGTFVKSIRGNRGGFVLTRDPREIRLGDVIRFVDGPLAPLGNKEDLEVLLENNERYAGLYKTLLDVRDACSDVLDTRTLWDICQMSEEIKKTQSKMYYI